MLARAQRTLTIGALLLAGLWFGIWWRAARPGWAVAGLVFVLIGHSLVLGMEFVFMGRVNRGDPAPPSSVIQRLAAWWGEARCAPLVFCWRQPFRSQRWPDFLPATQPLAQTPTRGIVLVHGFVCNRGLWNGWMPRLRALGVPHVAVNLEPVFGSIDDYLPIIEEAVRRVEQATGMPPLIVAHSMGGLAVRRWWAGVADDDRVHHIVTLGTPHRGTWLGRWALSANTVQMRLGSHWQAQLEQHETQTRRAKFTCFYSHCDNIVFPASTATLPGADNRHLAGVAHVQMVDRPQPFEEALRLLRAR
jgi:triacylglycerol lipase